MNAIYTWMLLTAAFLVIEALTAGLTTIWFAGGSVVALILTFLGAPIWLQAAAFAAISLILLLITRPVLVTEQIDNLRGTGEVQLDGQFWMARSVNSDQIIEKGEVAMVRDIQGVKLIVGKRIA